MSWTPLPVPHAWTPASAVSHSVVFVAGDAARTTFRVTDGTITGAWGLRGLSWSPGQRDVQYSGARGTLGRRPTSSTVQDAPLTVTLSLWPDGMDDAAQEMSDLARVVDLMGRYGGQVTLRRTGQAYRQHFQVLAGAGTQVAGWTPSQELDGRAELTIQFTCGPYIVGDPMEYRDDFTTDTRVDYAYDSGASGDVAVSGGELVPATAGTAVTMIHTASGYQLGDSRAGVTSLVGATVTGYKAGVVLKRVDASNRLEVYVDDTGAASRLRIDKVVAGVRTNLASTNLAARVTAAHPFRVVGHIQGNVVTAEHYLTARDPDYRPTPTTTTTTTLTSTDIALFGHDADGHCGVVWTAAATSARLTDVAVQPFAYLAPGSVGTRRLGGVIPGDAPALIDVEVAYGANIPEQGVFALTKAGAVNLVPLGTFDTGQGGTGSPPDGDVLWSVAAATGVTGAATSITLRNTGARYGTLSAEIVTPATANTGAHTRVFGPFRAGVTYRAELWARAASATTNTRLRFGVNGDIASETATALSGTWTRRTVDWTPATDQLVAWVAFEVTAATATTMQIDAVAAYEGTTAPTLPNHLRGGGGAPPCILLVPDAAVYNDEVAAVTATWPYLTTRILRRAAAGVLDSVVLAWLVDASAIDPDDHTDSVDVEVWALIRTPTGFAGRASVEGSREYPGGLTLPAATTDMYRLGTVPLPRQQVAPSSITITVLWTAGTGNVEIAWAMIVPARRRAIWATQMGEHFGVEAVYQTRSDGSARIRDDKYYGWRPYQGAGQTITADPDANVLTWAFPKIATQADVRLIRVTPTPRWHLQRTA